MKDKKQKLFLLLIILISFISTILNNNLGEGNGSIYNYVKGSDFSYFHIGAKLLAYSELYNPSRFKSEQLKVYPEEQVRGAWGALHPPMVFSLYLPIRSLDLVPALNIMTTVFFLLYTFLFFFLIYYWIDGKEQQVFLALIWFFFPPFLSSLIMGHPSVLWLISFLVAAVLQKQDKHFFSGIVLSILFLKPNLFFITGFIFLLSLNWKVCLGMFTGFMGILGIGSLAFGLEIWQDYYRVFLTYADFVNTDLSVHRQYSIKAFLQNLVPAQFVKIRVIVGYAATILGIGVLSLPAVYKFRNISRFQIERYWSIIALSLVLGNPHVYAYDLIVLIFPVLFLSQMFATRKVSREKILLFFAILFILLTIMGYITYYIRIQLTSVVCIYLLVKMMDSKKSVGLYIEKGIEKLPSIPLLNKIVCVKK